MKKSMSILVPVDFSENAKTAYRFALDIAEYLEASVKLLHVNTELIGTSRPTRIVQYPNSIEALRQQLTDFAEQGKKSEKSGSVQTKVETLVVEGITTVGEIVRQSPGFDLMIVGAKGQNLTSKKLFGSIPTLLAQKANIPVLVVPIETQFFAPQKMLFASNWESCKDSVIHQFINWASIFHAQANFLHVTQDYATDNYEHIQESIFNALEEYSDLEFSYLISEKKSDSPLAGILEYANEEDMDWIIVANRQKGFFNNILGLSMSKELTTNPRYPILVLKVAS